MRCPECRLINPETALRCDCGYDFASGSKKESYLVKKELPTGNLASLERRFLGRVLDKLIAVLALLGASLPAIISREVGQVTVVFGILLAGSYFLFADGLQGGQSYGKRIMKTAVVDATTGAPCTFGKSFVRNLLLAVLGIIDWVFVFGTNRQRLGDRAANTLVVKITPE